MFPRARALRDWDLFRVDNVDDAQEDVTSHTPEADEGDQGHVLSHEHESMYTRILNDMVQTVLVEESYLFSEQERDMFKRFSDLPYQSKYLLVRLCLRKEGKWHDYRSLSKRYYSDLGHKLQSAMERLCEDTPAAPEIIDLTEEETPVAIICQLEDMTTEQLLKQRELAFAVDDSEATMQDLFSCLRKEQLKSLATQLRIPNACSMTSGSLIAALERQSSGQTTLAFSKSGPLKQLTLNFDPRGNKLPQNGRLRTLMMKELVKCIRVNPLIMTLLQRLHLVYFRATTYTTDLFLPAILSRARRRKYAQYVYHRTKSIFPSREALLDYEKALKIEAEVDELLHGNGYLSSQATKASMEEEGKLTRQEAANKAQQLAGSVWKTWSHLLEVKEEHDDSVESANYLVRFEPGHVYTRILHMGVEALGIIKNYPAEVKVINALLAQQRWRRNRRGALYERKALIYMTYGKSFELPDEPAQREDLQASQDDGSDQKDNNRHLIQAHGIVLRGLADPFTHLIHRTALERRLTRIEKRLKIPSEQRRVCQGMLKSPKHVTIVGKRIKPRQETPLDQPSRNASIGPRSGPVGGEKGAVSRSSWTGKSLWHGASGDEVNVETLALEHYARAGFKGFHSEGRIVCSIFGLLFWDILFAPIPGAFETRYQNAPLDLFHDTFFAARQNMIEARLKELEDGKALELMTAVDERERERKTVCIGVHWDKFSKEDLYEIVECIGNKPLSVMGRILCEDYAGRTSGVPDLLVWNSETHEAKFVEVKGPGDNLQENQKIWIDCLLGSGTSVELCRVDDEDDLPVKKPKRRKKQKEVVEVESSDEEPEEEDPANDQQPQEESELAAHVTKKRRLGS